MRLRQAKKIMKSYCNSCRHVPYGRLNAACRRVSRSSSLPRAMLGPSPLKAAYSEYASIMKYCDGMYSRYFCLPRSLIEGELKLSGLAQISVSDENDPNHFKVLGYSHGPITVVSQMESPK